MAETLSMISLLSFIAAVVCLAVSVIIGFVFKIPSVIGDLSGRNARKSIQQMRRNNEKGRAEPVKRKQKENESKPDSIRETGILSENIVTEELEEEETTGLLAGGSSVPYAEPRKTKVKMTAIEDIVFIHTDEIIG